MTQARQENYRGVEEEFGTITRSDDELSNCEEVEVQRKHIKVG